MPRFAVLRHESDRDTHWDFFFETGEKLKTWAAEDAPRAGEQVACKELGEHRKVYLEYQGPISGDRGTVLRWDQGTFETEWQSDDAWIFKVAGQWLQGRLVFSRLADVANQWRLKFEPKPQ